MSGSGWQAIAVWLDGQIFFGLLKLYKIPNSITKESLKFCQILIKLRWLLIFQKIVTLDQGLIITLTLLCNWLGLVNFLTIRPSIEPICQWLNRSLRKVLQQRFSLRHDGFIFQNSWDLRHERVFWPAHRQHLRGPEDRVHREVDERPAYTMWTCRRGSWH